MENEKLMTIADLAEYLQLGKQTVYRMVQRGQIPAIKIGRTVRFRKAVIDHWLNTHIEARSKPPGIKQKTKKRG